jgi:RNA methyltransferase, TrmH family
LSARDFKTVISRDNARFKQLKQLASSSQARRKAGLTLLDGEHLVEAFLKHGGVPEVLAVSETALARPAARRLAEAAVGTQAEVLRMPDALLEAVSTVEHGAGMVAAMRTPEVALPKQIDTDALLLEAVQDPGNMGSLLRSAAAAGVRRVITTEHTVYAWSPKVLRAGQGAHFALEIIEGVKLAHVFSALAVRLAVTSSHAAESLYATKLVKPVVWAFGNEGAGASPELLARADLRVVIPMPGKAESLNVAAAGAVCLFEMVRQRSK